MHRFLTHTAARCPDRTAVCQGGREFTYGAVAEKARGVAAALGDVPISDRDRVVIAFGNGIAFMAAYFGVLTAGGIPVLIRRRRKSPPSSRMRKPPESWDTPGCSVRCRRGRPV